MAIKNYSYTLRVQKRDLSSFVEIKNPFSIDFNVVKTNFKGANTLTMKVYNLSPGTRESIRKDQAFHIDVSPRITFAAGREGFEPILFDGKVTSCTSIKEGVNTVTLITAFDDGLSRRMVSRRSYRAGTPKQVIIDDLISDLYPSGVTRGYVVPTTGTIKRGISIYSDTVTALHQMTGENFSIENMRANVYGYGTPIPSVITRVTGKDLLNTPSIQSVNIFWEQIFNPGLIIGQDLQLESSVNKQFNGKVNLISITHRGSISDSVKSSVTTSVGAKFFVGDDIAKRIKS